MQVQEVGVAARLETLFKSLDAAAITLGQNPDLIAARQAEGVSQGALGVAETYPFNPWVQVQLTPSPQLRDGLTGVWASKGKIASIGVHVSRRVTTHGFAVNVDNDLQPFEWIVPCGMEGAHMSSICKEIGRGGNLASFRETMADRFCEAFGRERRTAEPDRFVVSIRR